MAEGDLIPRLKMPTRTYRINGKPPNVKWVNWWQREQPGTGRSHRPRMTIQQQQTYDQQQAGKIRPAYPYVKPKPQDIEWYGQFWEPWKQPINQEPSAPGYTIRDQARPGKFPTLPTGAGYWNDPQKVARYYHLLQAQGGLPEFVPAQEVIAAYNYFRLNNAGKPWWEWKTDPAAGEILNRLQAPPPEALWPHEREKLEKIGLAKKGQVPGQIGAEGITPAQYDESEYPEIQKELLKLLQSPGGETMTAGIQMGALGGIQGAISGATAGAAGGIPGMLLGGVTGLVGGVVGGGVLGAGLGGLATRYPSLSNILLAADIPAEWVERIASVPAIFMAVNKQKQAGVWETAKNMGDMLLHMDDVLRAGHMFYEVSASGFGAEEGVVYDWNMPWKKGYGRKVDLGEPALYDIYNRIRSGERPETVYEDWNARVGLSGYAREMIGHMVLDPLNLLGGTGMINEPLRVIGKLTGNDALLTAAKITKSPTDAVKTYGQYLRTGFMTGLSTEDIAKQGGVAGTINRMLSGITPSGEFKWLEAPKPPSFLGRVGGAILTGTPATMIGLGIGGPPGALIGAIAGGGFGGYKGLGHLISLKPSAKAQELVNLTTQNARMIINGAENADDLAKMITMLRESPIELGRQLSTQLLGSPEGGVLQMVMKDFDLFDEAHAKYQATEPLRNTLDKLAKATGLTVDDILAEIGKSEKSADIVISRIKRRAAEQVDNPGAIALMQDIEAGTLNAKVIRNLYSTYVKDGVAYSFDHLKAQAFSMLATHADQWAAKWFNVKPDPAIVRLGQTIKNVQSLFLLGLNPTYFFNNAINNVVTMSYQGVMGFRTPRQLSQFWERVGDVPARLRAGVGIEGMGEIPLEAIRAASRSEGFLSAVDDIARGANNKLGIFGKASAEFEKLSSVQAYTKGFLNSWTQLWKPDVGFSRMDADLVRVLEAIDPALPDVIHGAIGRALNWKEIEGDLWRVANKKHATSFIDDIANAKGIDPVVARQILEDTGILHELDKLGDNYTAGDVASKFEEIIRKAEDVMDTQLREEIYHDATMARDLVNTEGAQAGFRLFDQMSLDYTETWFNHWVRMAEVAAEAKRIGDLGGDAGAVWRQGFAETQRHWQRMRTRNEARLAGIIDAFGLDNQSGIEISDRYIKIQEEWGAFYKKRDELYLEMQNGKLTWEEVQTQLQEMYDGTFDRIEGINDELDILVTGLFQNQYGNEIGQAVTEWRQGIKAIRDKMHGDMNDHRQLGGREWAEFLNSDYLQDIRKLHTDNIEAASALYMAVMGGVAPETLPLGDTPKIPKLDWKEGGSNLANSAEAREALDLQMIELKKLEDNARNIRTIAADSYGFEWFEKDGVTRQGAQHHLLAILNYERRRSGQPLLKHIGEATEADARTQLANWVERHKQIADEKLSTPSTKPPMVSVSQEAELRAMGYNDRTIWKLDPAEADALIRGSIPADELERVTPLSDAIKSLDDGFVDAAIKKGIDLEAEDRAHLAQLMTPETRAIAENAWRIDDRIVEGDYNSAFIPEELRQQIGMVIGRLQEAIGAAEKGEQVKDPVTGEWSKRPSTYPAWYGRSIGYSNQYYVEGKKLTGKYAVVAALADIATGNVNQRTAIVKKLQAVIASEVSDTAVYRRTLGLWEDELYRVTQELNSLASSYQRNIDMMGSDVLASWRQETTAALEKVIEVHDLAGKETPDWIFEKIGEMHSLIDDRIDEISDMTRVQTSQEVAKAQVEKIERIKAHQEAYNERIQNPYLLTSKEWAERAHQVATEYFGATDAQASAYVKLMQARARVWAEQTGKPANQYWDEHFGAFIKGAPDSLDERLAQVDIDLLRMQRQGYKRPDTRSPLLQKAKSIWGTTDDLRKAGYLLPDGDLLDFSNGGRVRELDHTDIWQAFGDRHDAVTEALYGQDIIDFTEQTGAARIYRYGDELALELRNPLTKDQVHALQMAMINDKPKRVVVTVYGTGDLAGIGLDTITYYGGEFTADRIAKMGNYLTELYKGVSVPSRAMLYQIPVERARKLRYPVRIPEDAEFLRALQAHGDNVKLTDDGIIVNLARRQAPEQEGALSTRSGVFYLVEGDRNIKYYTGKSGYGGSEVYKGATLYKAPYVVKGFTGGRGPEKFLLEMIGKGARGEYEKDLWKVASLHSMLYLRPDGGTGKDLRRSLATIQEVFKKYTGSTLSAHEAQYIYENSSWGNQLRYAVQERIVAELARKEGYDSIITYGKGKIREIFDVREVTYPSDVVEPQIHKSFLYQMTNDGVSPLYSQQYENIVNLPQDTMTAQQALNILKKNTKAEELEWTGIKELLEGMPVDRKITKQELLRLHQKGQVKVQEVLQGKDPGELMSWVYFDELDLDQFPVHDLQPSLRQYVETGERPPMMDTEIMAWRSNNGDATIMLADNEWSTWFRHFDSHGEPYWVKSAHPPVRRHIASADIQRSLRLNTEYLFPNFGRRTQYEKYILPGHQDRYAGYRELLFTLEPEVIDYEHVSPSPEVIQKYDYAWGYLQEEFNDTRQLIAENIEAKSHFEQDTKEYTEIHERLDRLYEMLDEQSKEINKLHSKMVAETVEQMDARWSQYESPHWDNDNVVSHVRFTDRVSTDGDTVLMIEEFQSDWHQAGRKYGYDEDNTRVRRDQKVQEYEAYKAHVEEGDHWVTDQGWLERKSDAGEGVVVPLEVVQMEKEYYDGIRNMWYIYDIQRDRYIFDDALQIVGDNPQDILNAFYDSTGGGHYTRYEYRGSRPLLAPTAEEAQVMRKLHAIKTELTGAANEIARLNKRSVPRAPFEKSWLPMSIKRMIKWAVDNGIDEIAWTTGKQQAERYDLRQHVDAIHVRVESDGRAIYRATRGERDVPHMSGYSQLDTIGDYLGDNIGAQLKEGFDQGKTEFTFEGEDLSIGGQGMYRFYDEIVPNTVKKLLKQYGVEVQKKEIATNQIGTKRANRMLYAVEELPDGGAWLIDPYGQPYGYPSVEEAWKALDKMLMPETVWTAKITPELRMSVEKKSLPLFQNKRVSRAQQFVNRLDELGRVPAKVVAGVLSSKQAPEYLQGMMEFMLAQRKKLLEGNVTQRDVAKALLISVASQHASEIKLSTFQAKLAALDIHIDLPQEYILKKGSVDFIRPEDAAAAWLLSPEGKIALDTLDAGVGIVEAFQPLVDIRKIWGNDQFSTAQVFAPGTDKKFSMLNLQEVVDGINALGKQAATGTNITKELDALQIKLQGIGRGKAGFINHLLGFGNSPTVDTVAINMWTTGVGTTRFGDDTPMVQLLREIRSTPSVFQGKVGDWFYDGIVDGMRELRENGYGADIPAEIYEHVMHHWIWDQAKETSTDHKAMYDAMLYAQKFFGEGTAKGAIEFDAEGKAIIYAMEQADVSTLVHETAHVFRRDLATSNPEDLAVAAKWAGAEQVDGGGYYWTVEAEEKFARGFERYLASGKAPAPFLQEVFQKFKTWLLNIYTTIKGSQIDVKVNKDIQGVFDRLLALESEISPVLTQRGKPAQQELPGLGFADTFQLQSQKGKESIFKPEEQAQPELPGLPQKARPELRPPWADSLLAEVKALREEIGADATLSRTQRQQAFDDAKMLFDIAQMKYSDGRYMVEVLDEMLVKNRKITHAGGHMYLTGGGNKWNIRTKIERQYVTYQLERKLNVNTPGKQGALFQKKRYITAYRAQDIAGKITGKQLSLSDENLKGRYIVTITIDTENQNILKAVSEGMTMDDLLGNTVEGQFKDLTPEKLEKYYGAKIEYVRSEDHYKNRTPGQWFETDNGPRRILAQEDDGIVYQDGTGTHAQPVDGDDTPALGIQPGTIEDLQGPPIGNIQAEAWEKTILPMLNDMKSRMLDDAQNTQKDFRHAELPDDVRALLARYQKKVQGEMIDAKNASIRFGEMQRDRALLNYSARTGLDDYLQIVFPYQFWYTRSAIQWALRALDKPQVYAQYARLREAQKTLLPTEGYPTRLQGKMRIPVPFLPKWAGGGVYVDPFHLLFPFEQIARPYEVWANQKNQLEKRTEYEVMQMLANEEITEAQAREALTTRADDNQVWTGAQALAQRAVEMDITNPFDLLQTITGTSLPVSVAYNALRGKPDKIGLLPMTRLIKSLTAWATPGGLNIEAPIRRAVGLPEDTPLSNYYIDRELANMTAEGLITPEEAKLAMVEREGEAYTMALSRSGKQQAVKTLGGFLWLDFFPEGEMKQRQLQLKFSEAMDSGNSMAIREFFDQNPEYSARMAQMDWEDPDARLRNFLKSNIWETWNEAGDLYKREIKKQFGEQFIRDFLTKDTRNYDAIDTETLAQWARSMPGGYDAKGIAAPAKGIETEVTSASGQLVLPSEELAAKYDEYQNYVQENYPGINTVQQFLYALPEHRQSTYREMYPQLAQYQYFKDKYMMNNPDLIPYLIGEKNKLYDADPEVQKLVLEYRVARVENFGEDIFEIQSGYFAIPKAQRKAYLVSFPQLTQYWDWRREVLDAYPELKKYISSTPSITEMAQEATQITRDAQYDPAPTISKRYFTPTVVSALQGYWYGGEKLRPGARTELKRIWNEAGQPGRSFQEFIDVVARVSLGTP